MRLRHRFYAPGRHSNARLSNCRSCPRAVDLDQEAVAHPLRYQEPFELCCRKIGVENKATTRFYQRLVPLGLQLFTDICCPTTLPDDRVMNGFACLCVPKYSGLSLIGDTNCRYVCSIKV